MPQTKEMLNKGNPKSSYSNVESHSLWFFHLKWYTEVLEFEQDGGGYPHDKPIFYGFKSNGGADFSIMEVENEKSYGRFNFNVGDEVDTLWEKLKDYQCHFRQGL